MKQGEICSPFFSADFKLSFCVQGNMVSQKNYRGYCSLEAAKDRTESNLKEGGLTAKCKDVGNPSRLDLILTPLNFLKNFIISKQN